MKSTRQASLAMSVALCGCGTIASVSPGNVNLPDNRTGPFRPLTTAETGGTQCVATDSTGSYDQPSALVLADGTTGLYVTHTRGGASSIARLVLRNGVVAGAAMDVLTSTQPWEGGAVASPAVITVPGGGFAMAYAAAGAVGIATSNDGIVWTTQSAPVLTADPTQGEGSLLGGPSLVAVPSGGFVLAYASGGSLWTARATVVAGPYTRVDTVPATAVRDPIVGPSTVPDAGVQFWSGGRTEPDLTIERTATGRLIWRVYYGAAAPPGLDAGLPAQSIGMAASFDGVTFVDVGSPVLSVPMNNVAAPAMVPRDAMVTLLYVGADCVTAGTGRGIMATVAPETVTLAAP